MSESPEPLPAVPPVTSEPTQVDHPFKATMRTFVQALIGLVSVWSIVDLVLTDFLNEVGWASALPYLAIASAIVAAVARIMAIPQVNAWLTKIGLGATPKQT